MVPFLTHGGILVAGHRNGRRKYKTIPDCAVSIPMSADLFQKGSPGTILLMNILKLKG